MNIFKHFVFIAVFSLIFLSAASANQNEWGWKDVDATFTTGIKSGHITFKIGGFISNGQTIGKAHFPISELIFPRNYKTAQFSLTLKGHNNWDVLFELETNLSKDAGLLEDRDWLSPDSLDIYSDTKTSVSAQEVLLEISNKLDPIELSTNLGVINNRFGFGLLGQFYDYRGYDTIQSYPSSPMPAISIEGDTIKFKFSQITPFASYQVSHHISKSVRLDSKFRLSPFMFAKDEDHHLLRDKSSQSNTRGWFFDSSISMHWSVNQALGVYTQISYQLFESSGEQTQKNEADSEAKDLQVKVKHLGQQTNLKVGLNFQF